MPSLIFNVEKFSVVYSNALFGSVGLGCVVFSKLRFIMKKGYILFFEHNENLPFFSFKIKYPKKIIKYFLPDHRFKTKIMSCKEYKDFINLNRWYK